VTPWSKKDPDNQTKDSQTMPRIAGVRQRLHQPFYDSLVRTTGNPVPAIQNGALLFGNANIGNLGLTNLQVAGQLASDQTYVALALRSWLFFDGTNARANYQGVASQLIYTLIVGNKPMFVSPAWYLPAGGGVWGFDATNAIYNNGDPEQTSILKLARPIVFPVRQNFSVRCDFFAIGGTVALTLLNAGAQDDQKVIMYIIDGLQTRDVE
jgi:hypothetical protein